MSIRGMDVPWPSLADVSLDLTRVALGPLLPAELGAFARLAHCIATMMVNTYATAKLDPILPTDDEQLARVARCGLREWKKIKLRVMAEGFELRADGWHLTADIVRISRASVRNPIPMAVKAAVLARDGSRCVYCGNQEGPFHFDHLFPVSKGGPDATANIVVACQSCNLSKHDMTLLEWVEFLRGRS